MPQTSIGNVGGGNVLDMDDFAEFISPICERVGARVAAEWPGVEAEDARQEAMIQVCRQADTIIAKDEGDWPGLIRYVANRGAIEYAVREIRHYQNGRAEWVYTPQEVRQVLPLFFAGTGSEDAPRRPAPGSQTLMGDGVSILHMDMRAAYEALPERSQVALLRRYVTGEPLDANARKAAERSVVRITDTLNGAISGRFDRDGHEGPGARTAMDNAYARYVTGDGG